MLGPNGAGKTTIVNILSTLITPDAGSATVAGANLAENPDGIRRAIGVTGQFSAVDDLLNGEENLMLMADLHHLLRTTGRARAAELLARFGLTDAAKTIPLTWMAVAVGLNAKSVETASNTPMIFTLLPFLGSGFVPNDSLPGWLRWFAEYQPFTPVIKTVRGLLLGTSVGDSGLLAVGWCVLFAIVGYVWSKSLFRKERTR
jgi:hypothetical protein